jgi:hypothetical protein
VIYRAVLVAGIRLVKESLPRAACLVMEHDLEAVFQVPLVDGIHVLHVEALLATGWMGG